VQPCIGLRRDLEFPAPYPRCAPSCRERKGPGTRDTGWRGSKKGKRGGTGELGQGAAGWTIPAEAQRFGNWDKRERGRRSAGAKYTVKYLKQNVSVKCADR
jgi:hypothetical protein